MSLYQEKQSQQTSSKKCRKTYNRNSGSSIREQLLLLASTSRLTRTTSTRVSPWRERFTNTRRRWGRRWRRGAAPQHNNHLRLYLNFTLLIRDANNKQQQTTSRRCQWLLHIYRNQRSQEGSTRAGAVRCGALRAACLLAPAETGDRLMTRNNSLRFFSVGGDYSSVRERDSMRLLFSYNCIENSSLHYTDHRVSSNDKKLQASKQACHWSEINQKPSL